MYQKSLPFALAFLLMACHSPTNPTSTTPSPIGGQTDQHGCVSSTGATWSVLKNQCVKAFDVADIRLSETVNGTTSGVYVILSDDRQQAEVFAVSLPKPIILTAVKGGYVSDDNKIRLLNTAQGWKLTKQ